MKHLEWLEGEVTKRTNGRMACHRVATEKFETLTKAIEDRSAGNGKRWVSAPFFTEGGGIVPRKCTTEFKVKPLTKKQRELLGYKPRQRIPPKSCEIWIGISTDEVIRAGASWETWAVHRFPLLEKRMSRSDCELWLMRKGYPVPPKSACVFCPYHSNLQWKFLRDNDPEGWEEAKRIDAMIRDTPGMNKRQFLHNSLVPLGEVDLSTAEERGQGFLFECEGGCGV
jgi:hypothetical protein